jgi:hypothetical protein
MSARGSKFLRRSLATVAAAVALLAASSFFFGFFIYFQLKSAEGSGNVVWTGISSNRGAFTLDYERFPAIFDVALAKTWGRGIPGVHRARIGQRLEIRCITMGGAPSAWAWPSMWWFQVAKQDFRAPIPTVATTAPTTAPAITYPLHLSHFSIPYWFLLLPVAIYAVYRLVDLPNQRLRKRFAAGQCLACGYDLRYTPDRCPECGLVPTGLAPPRRSLPFRAPAAIGAPLWWRICFYPGFFGLFTITFRWSYFWYYQK